MNSYGIHGKLAPVDPKPTRLAALAVSQERFAPLPPPAHLRENTYESSLVQARPS